MPDTMPQYVSVSDAAHVLGVSRRTVDRRIRSGQLSVIVQDGQKLVVLEDKPGTPVMSETPPDTVSELATLRAQVEMLTSERDHLRQTVDKLSGTVDRLTISLAQLSGAVVDQQALVAGVDTPEGDTAPPESVQRPWWQFWRR